MGLSDKAQHKAEDLAGKAKEATGKVTDNESLEAEGQADQDKAALKSAGDKIKDAVQDVKNRL